MPGPTDPPEWVKENKGRAQSALDRARNLKQPEVQKAPERVPSEQVRQSAPAMQPKPPSQVRQAVDRGAHNERMQKDNQTAKYARAKELQASIARRQQEAQKSKDKERER